MDEFKCSDVRRNMIDLCFDPPEVTTPMIEDREILTNEVDVNETVAVKKKSDGTLTVPPALKSVITPSVILALFMSKRYH